MRVLFVSDLDGTLLNNQKRITSYTKDSLNRFIEAGGIFSVATARTAGTAVEMLKEINLSCPIVLMNGAMIFDIEKEQYIKYEVIEKDIFLKICTLIKKYRANGFIYTFNGEKIIAFYEKITEVSEEFYKQRAESDRYKEFFETSDFKNESDRDCVYFALLDSYEKLKKISDEIENDNVSKALYEDIYEKGLYYLEIFSKKATKANGVKFLKEYILADRVICFGDNLNDLDMLEISDVSVAVENAVEEVKKAADFICKNNEESGVAKFIETSEELWNAKDI